MKNPETHIHTTTPDVGSLKGHRVQFRTKRQHAAEAAYAAVTEAHWASCRPRRVVRVDAGDGE